MMPWMRLLNISKLERLPNHHGGRVSSRGQLKHIHTMTKREKTQLQAFIYDIARDFIGGLFIFAFFIAMAFLLAFK